MLKLNDIGKRFGDFVALENISFELASGASLAIIGPNGAGKSTLLNVLSGQTPASSGAFSLSGHALTGLNSLQIAQMGLRRSFQISQLFDGLTVAEHIALLMPKSSLKARQTEADKWALLPRWHEGAAKLSYGEQRALELMLALSADAKCVLLDEPSAGMAANDAKVFMQRVKAQTQGKTVVLVEHDMQTVFRFADYIAVLAAGRLIALDTPERIVKNGAALEAYPMLLNPIEEENAAHA